ncbi:MAG: hypothetical protein K2X86_08550 [Cytophagaceae bacterium]|nr:hypothetical protein [Cytophagaceae bacterium]
MENLVTSDKPKKFYVWVQTKDIYANFNANIVGSFVSVANKEDNLMFLPNENFSGYISPFQGNLLRSYQAEYKLETTRKKHFPDHPSRLVATFLFETEEEAMTYKETHSLHVGSRELKVGSTVGPYSYSKHDLSWIDFLRSPLLTDKDIIKKIAFSYWEGKSVDNFRLELSEKPLAVVSIPIYEVLFIGRIDF